MSRLPLTLRQPDSVTPSVAALPEIAAQAAPATFGHALTAYTLMNNHTARILKNEVFTAGLATRLTDPQVWGESLQLQSAVVQRLQQQEGRSEGKQQYDCGLPDPVQQISRHQPILL